MPEPSSVTSLLRLFVTSLLRLYSGGSELSSGVGVRVGPGHRPGLRDGQAVRRGVQDARVGEPAEVGDPCGGGGHGSAAISAEGELFLWCASLVTHLRFCPFAAQN